MCTDYRRDWWRLRRGLRGKRVGLQKRRVGIKRGMVWVLN